MKKTFKYRIYANKETINNAKKWLELCRKLYNSALEEQINTYKETGKGISCNAQMLKLKPFKQKFPEYKQVGSQVLQDVLQRLDLAYKHFFRRVKNGDNPGFPRFRGYDRYHSFTLKQAGWKLVGKYLTIKNIGTFKIKLSRPIEGTIKTITIKRSSTDKWFVYFSCDNVPDRPLSYNEEEIGLDVGCESFITDSNGNKIENPRFINKAQESLTFRQQRLARRKKGSNRRKKARVLVAKVYEKIYNQRRNFHFKIANNLVKQFGFIYIENLHNWKTFRSLNRSMRDVSWFGFFDILCFKAEEAGRQVIKVPAKNTSQMCSSCGAIVKKDLSVRVHNCPYCSLTIDRDFNSAINILRLGRSLRMNSVPRISRL
jgi:putative transposase